MAVQLRLPELAGLPSVVLFHREHPAEPVIVLQVPDPAATESETYLIRLDRPAHQSWMEHLPEGKRLLDLLKMEMHVVFEPATGAMAAMQDLDESSPLACAIQDARRGADSRARAEQTRRPGSNVPAMSRFRMALMGRLPGMPASSRGGGIR